MMTSPSDNSYPVATQPTDKYHWVGSIETVGGHTVDVLNFSQEMVRLNDICHALSMICRYGGHVPSFYSVAEHSVRVALELRIAGHPPAVQMAGLLHDAAEAYVGDMVRPLKRVDSFSKAHQELEAHITEQVFKEFGAVYPIPDVVHDTDKALYYWEVDLIRTGITSGWDWQHAKHAFKDRFFHIDSDMCLERSANA